MGPVIISYSTTPTTQFLEDLILGNGLTDYQNILLNDTSNNIRKKEKGKSKKGEANN